MRIARAFVIASLFSIAPLLVPPVHAFATLEQRVDAYYGPGSYKKLKQSQTDEKIEDDLKDYIHDYRERYERAIQLMLSVRNPKLPRLNPAKDPTQHLAILSSGTPQVYKAANFGFGTDPDEPRAERAMQRTAWRYYRAVEDMRLVAWTYFSDYDTQLAAYDYDGRTAPIELAFNDNKPVAGLSTNASLVAFDVKKGDDFALQIGAASGEEGDFFLSLLGLPPAGGLVVQNADFGRDYLCDLGSGGLSQCEPARFLVYNATDQVLTVEGTTSFGLDVAAEAPFRLKPGQIVLKTFTFGAGFDTTSVRGLSGTFAFTGTADDGTTIAKAEARGFISVNGFEEADALLAVHAPRIAQSVAIGERALFPVKIANRGTEAAVGCQFRASGWPDVRSEWMRVDPATGEPRGKPNPAFEVAPGATVSLVVAVTSRVTRTIDIDFAPAAFVTCANLDRFVDRAGDAANFDFGATIQQAARFDLARIGKVRKGVLTVPEEGVVVPVVFENTGLKGEIEALVSYTHPGDSAEKHFPVAVCAGTVSDTDCLGSQTGSQTLTVRAGASVKLKLAVKAPLSDPGFDPETRRVTLAIRQAHPEFGMIDTESLAFAVRVK